MIISASRAVTTAVIETGTIGTVTVSATVTVTAQGIVTDNATTARAEL